MNFAIKSSFYEGGKNTNKKYKKYKTYKNIFNYILSFSIIFHQYRYKINKRGQFLTREISN